LLDKAGRFPRQHWRGGGRKHPKTWSRADYSEGDASIIPAGVGTGPNSGESAGYFLGVGRNASLCALRESVIESFETIFRVRA